MRTGQHFAPSSSAGEVRARAAHLDARVADERVVDQLVEAALRAAELERAGSSMRVERARAATVVARRRKAKVAFPCKLPDV